MSVLITLLDKKTNKQKVYYDAYSDEEKYEDSFWWTDGNMACDCNRSICFYGDMDESVPCYEEEFKGERFEVTKWEKLMHLDIRMYENLCGWLKLVEKKEDESHLDWAMRVLKMRTNKDIVLIEMSKEEFEEECNKTVVEIIARLSSSGAEKND